MGIDLVVSDKKIFKISANENTLWTLAAMLDFKSAPKNKSGRGPFSEHFWQVWLKSGDFAGMIIGWSCTKLVNRLPIGNSRWPP
jgi:hypothetical protein